MANDEDGSARRSGPQRWHAQRWVVDANPTRDPVRMFFQSSVPGGHENYLAVERRIDRSVCTAFLPLPERDARRHR